MPKADRTDTTGPARAASGGVAMAADATIDRLREIARRSADSPLLADAPPHPDAALLGLAGDILHLTGEADRCMAAARALVDADKFARGLTYHGPSAAQPRIEQLTMDSIRLRQDAATLIKRAGKLRAITPAGIYSKLLIIRASRTGAALLAQGLAADLIGHPALRTSLWPASAEGDAP